MQRSPPTPPFSISSFLNMNSNCLLEIMHNRTGRMTFLHCVFSKFGPKNGKNLDKSWRHIATRHPATGPWGLWGVWGQFSIQLLKATFQNQHLTFFYWEERSNAYSFSSLEIASLKLCNSAGAHLSAVFCFVFGSEIGFCTSDQNWKRQQRFVCSEISGGVVLW